MKIKETDFKGLYLIEAEPIEDNRGFFMELFRKNVFAEAGISTDFLQVNQSFSKSNVLRAFHFQYDPPLGKMMRVVGGQAFLVAVDIRKKSPTFGKWFGEEFSDSGAKKAIYASPGFAMGFCVTGEFAKMEYHFNAYYNKNGESAFKWNDPRIGVKWPIKGEPIVSERDDSAQSFDEWLKRPESDLF
ncbi:MAG: dTDP-4-dehydrorhamnose 3,5-epimerase [Patescibacteria group bacterium]|nr:dTDP-4-dehydrorhamnose 3,5-epimerase [Patescibacteria group bacterium]MDE2015267.1 dTDP-4-dehydrorhamnose 3,5-epimerase [Patescibacteria group bacterium]MDE2227073.1 dTDP-4-dehydrorhamnose 3,5-epimerase [Patescibacteria group bacterium]